MTTVTSNKLVLVWALALTALLFMGMTIPNSFSPDTTISSAAVNANFSAVKTAVDALESATRRGTIMFFGRVVHNAGLPSWAPGAYTSSGGPLPTFGLYTPGFGSYLIQIPGGFDLSAHGVVVTPINIPLVGHLVRVATIESFDPGGGLPKELFITIADASGASLPTDFQVIIFNK